MRLRARCVLLGAGVELSPGEVVWNRAGRIVELRRARGRYDDVCVLPGLVDAHTHLAIDGAAPAGAGFVPWARSVMAARAGKASDELQVTALRAARARLREGVTAVGEVDSTGDSSAALLGLGFAGRCYQELTGYHLDRTAAAARVRDRRRAGSTALRAGLSPHAPYSVSVDLFRAAARAARFLAVHCAETAEEQQFLRRGTGPFADLLTDLGRLPVGHRAPGVGAVRWLDQLGVLRASTQLVHCQELEDGDVERIAASRAPVVVCPGTMSWFDRPAPPVPEWLDAGITVALGSDSRASNADWSMRSAMAEAARRWPQLAPAAIFAMATTAGARALGYPGLGRLTVGGRADLVAVPARADRARDHLEAFVRGYLRPCRVWVRGRESALSAPPERADRPRR